MAKGKPTTDPENHTGEGIFFTSRLFDGFDILSRNVFLAYDSRTREDRIQETPEFRGNLVVLELDNDTRNTLKQVFDEHSEDGDDGFSKTVVPVGLISRSQAKRLLTRFDRFRKVILDFTGVERIGQGFADEVFRVFTRAHSNVELVPFNVNQQVAAMIQHLRSTV